ncbi:MAG: carboxypeptidase regulatory-like domain-containing protein [Planctomycetota bacterium]
MTTKFRLVCFVVAVLVGCNNSDRPPLGRVTGTVTVNGKPTEGIGVIFSQEGFRSSSGVTDSAGEYELVYLKDVNGAVIGENRVRLKYVPGESTQSRKPIPQTYNRDSKLTANVKRGRNRFDFEIKAD